MAAAKLGAWCCTLPDNRLSWTSGVYDLFGLPIGAGLDRRLAVEMYTDESRDTLERVRNHAIAVGGILALDARIRRACGEMRWIRITGEVARDAAGATFLHGLKQDVTEEKLRLETLRRSAENDALTNLASRAVYESRFLNRRRTAANMVPLGALVLFDLDGFKGINDRFGHLAGDACLKIFSERLVGSFPEAVLTARIGGDEFAVILNTDEPTDRIKARIARFMARLRAPIVWREHMFTIGATCGLAVPDDPYSYDPEELFVRADTALYAAKSTNRRARASDRR